MLWVFCKVGGLHGFSDVMSGQDITVEAKPGIFDDWVIPGDRQRNEFLPKGAVDPFTGWLICDVDPGTQFSG